MVLPRHRQSRARVPGPPPPLSPLARPVTPPPPPPPPPQRILLWVVTWAATMLCRPQQTRRMSGRASECLLTRRGESSVRASLVGALRVRSVGGALRWTDCSHTRPSAPNSAAGQRAVGVRVGLGARLVHTLVVPAHSLGPSPHHLHLSSRPAPPPAFRGELSWEHDPRAAPVPGETLRITQGGEGSGASSEPSKDRFDLRSNRSGTRAMMG